MQLERGIAVIRLASDQKLEVREQQWQMVLAQQMSRLKQDPSSSFSFYARGRELYDLYQTMLRAQQQVQAASASRFAVGSNIL